MEAVKQDGRALQYASAELKGDREIVMAAVKQNWCALLVLEYASAELQGDREIVMVAVKQNGRALLEYACRAEGSWKVLVPLVLVLAAVPSCRATGDRDGGRQAERVRAVRRPS